MNKASSGWDYSNNAVKWGFRINTFKVTWFKTGFGRFSTSSFATTSAQKLILFPWDQYQNWLYQRQEEEIRVYSMTVFYSTPYTVKETKWAQKLQWIYNELYLHVVFTQYYLCSNFLHEFWFYRCFLPINLWWIWNAGEPNAKHSIYCCPSLQNLCGATWSPLNTGQKGSRAALQSLYCCDSLKQSQRLCWPHWHHLPVQKGYMNLLHQYLMGEERVLTPAMLLSFKMHSHFALVLFCKAFRYSFVVVAAVVVPLHRHIALLFWAWPPPPCACLRGPSTHSQEGRAAGGVPRPYPSTAGHEDRRGHDVSPQLPLPPTSNERGHRSRCTAKKLLGLCSWLNCSELPNFQFLDLLQTEITKAQDKYSMLVRESKIHGVAFCPDVTKWRRRKLCLSFAEMKNCKSFGRASPHYAREGNEAETFTGGQASYSSYSWYCWYSQ